MADDNDTKICITLDGYKAACFLVNCESLKAKGILQDGPEIDLELFKAIKVIGERSGWPEPNEEDCKNLADYFRKGGKWEQEFCQPQEGTAT